MQFNLWKNQLRKTFIALLALTAMATTISAADAPAFIQKGGVFARVVEVSSNKMVEWYNTTQHKLKISYKLTLEGDKTREGDTTVDSKQRLQDTTTKSAADITQIKIVKIAIVD